ncbi:MAG: glycosyltransferase family 4 protein [Alphaproteobacteria bacterium]
MKIAFYLENKNIPNVDFTAPEAGNPGCGGTEYLFAATPYYIQKHLKYQISTILLANNVAHLPDNCKAHQVDDLYHAATKAKELGIDLFIYRPRRDTDSDFLSLIENIALPTIAWAHITPKPNHLRAMAKNKYLKALVCVEHEQYDQIQDTILSAYAKATFIVNGFDVNSFRLKTPPQKQNNLVVYLGALVPQKGFHLLARTWPQILKRVPDAKLTVIGTGQLYDHAAKLGPWGIADSRYEQEYLMPYLGDEQNRPHPSVTFSGRLGEEKKEILHSALIGVPNPTGQTENCPGSALEFQACGTAVVSGAYWGMLDTIADGYSGYLGKTDKDLEDNIVKLLKNPQQAIELGKNGVTFVSEKYRWESVIKEWENLFKYIQNNQTIPRKPFKKNWLKHYKWMIIANTAPQRLIGKYIYWPSTQEIKLFILKSLKKR